MSEDTRIPTAKKLSTEVPPNQGVTIRSKDPSELKDGEIVWILSKRPNEVAAVDQPFKVVMQDGKMILEPVEEDKQDVERRKELAKAIVRSHREEIMEQALEVTEQALSRKPLEKLEKMDKKGKEGSKAEVKTKKGCVFLNIGGEEVVL